MAGNCAGIIENIGDGKSNLFHQIVCILFHQPVNLSAR